jgi:hypothetical protein
MPPGHGCLSVVCCVCCQVEISATSWSLVQRSPTDCGALLCVIKKPRGRGGHRLRWAAEPEKRNNRGFRCLSKMQTKLLRKYFKEFQASEYSSDYTLMEFSNFYVLHEPLKWWHYAQPVNVCEDWTHLLLYIIYIISRSRVGIMLWEFPFVLWFFDPIPGHAPPPLTGFVFTHVGHTTLSRTPLDEWSHRPRNLSLTKHNTHKILSIYNPGAIRNYEPSKREAIEPSLSPNDHCDRPLWYITFGNNSVVTTVQ